MVHKKNGKSKANQTTTLQQKKDANVSGTIKLAGKAAETSHKGNQAASKVVIQQQQITIDELLVRTVKLEERVTELEGGLAPASHVTSVLQEQLTAKADELEIYSRRSCIVLTGLCKEENKNLNKKKIMLKRYARREYLKKKLLTTSTNSTEFEKPTKIIRKTLS